MKKAMPSPVPNSTVAPSDMREAKQILHAQRSSRMASADQRQHDRRHHLDQRAERIGPEPGYKRGRRAEIGERKRRSCRSARPAANRRTARRHRAGCRRGWSPASALWRPRENRRRPPDARRLVEAQQRDDPRGEPEQRQHGKDRRLQEVEPRKPDILDAGGLRRQRFSSDLERLAGSPAAVRCTMTPAGSDRWPSSAAASASRDGRGGRRPPTPAARRQAGTSKVGPVASRARLGAARRLRASVRISGAAISRSLPAAMCPAIASAHAVRDIVERHELHRRIAVHERRSPGERGKPRSRAEPPCALRPMTIAGRRMTKGTPDLASASSARRLVARNGVSRPAPSMRAEIWTISRIRRRTAASIECKHRSLLDRGDIVGGAVLQSAGAFTTASIPASSGFQSGAPARRATSAPIHSASGRRCAAAATSRASAFT